MLAASETTWSQGIIYVVPQQTVRYSGIVPDNYDIPLDINGDGNPDFILSSRVNETVVLTPQGNNSIIAIPEPPPDLGYFVAALGQGTSVGSSLEPVLNAQWYNNQTDQFGNAAIGAMASFDQQVIILGNFIGLPSAYIGFDLVENGNNHYGWMQVSNPFPILYGDIVDWAYQSSPNIPIEAGAVPEPSTWGLLMLSVILFSAKRKRPSFPKTARVCWNS